MDYMRDFVFAYGFIGIVARFICIIFSIFSKKSLEIKLVEVQRIDALADACYKLFAMLTAGFICLCVLNYIGWLH